MNILVDVWYVVTGLIGAMLGIGSILLALIGSLFCFILIDTIIKREWDEVILSSGIILFSIIFVSITMFVNVKAVQDNKVVSSEVQNIFAYDGVSHESSGKYSYDYMYFKQGNPKDYTIFKLNINECKMHDTDDEDVKIVKNSTKYTSPYRNLAIFNLDENIYYDVYIPNKDE